MTVGRLGVLLLGILALPLGGFCFGVCLSLVRAGAGISASSGDDQFTPLTLGAEYAVFSVISLFAVFLIPLAVLTTFLLRAVLLRGQIGKGHSEN